MLIIVLDTLRYDRFAPPAPAWLTPNLNRLAANGVRFENAWANSSWSLPSQATILTGRYPHEHEADWPSLQLRRTCPTLGDYLTSLGYVTGAFSGNSSWITPEYVGRGFLRFEVYTWEDHLRRTGNGRKLGRLLQEFGFHYAGRGKKAPTINRQFLSFLDDYPERPYFGYLCYMDVNQGFHHKKLNHPFWQAVPPVESILAAYDHALHTLDAQIGELFAELDRRGRLENTLVIITSDHGESFGAETGVDHDPTGHGTSLYPEQTRVPLFVIPPNNRLAGLSVDSPVGIHQIPATIMSLLGRVDTPFIGEPLPMGGAREGGSRQDTIPILLTLNYDVHRIQGMIWDRWLYLNNLGNPHETEELYDLAADPLAKTSVAGRNVLLPSMRGQLRSLLT